MQAHFTVSKLPPFWQLRTVQAVDAGAAVVVGVVVGIVVVVVTVAAVVLHFPHNTGQ